MLSGAGEPQSLQICSSSTHPAEAGQDDQVEEAVRRLEADMERLRSAPSAPADGGKAPAGPDGSEARGEGWPRWLARMLLRRYRSKPGAQQKKKSRSSRSLPGVAQLPVLIGEPFAMLTAESESDEDDEDDELSPLWRRCWSRPI